MKAKMLLGLAALTATASSAPATVVEELGRDNPYNYSHVRFVDRVGPNWLFRGGIPINSSGEFAYPELAAAFRSRAAEAGEPTFPDRFYLIDMCLLTGEADDIALERTFFEEHPELGQFLSWPIYGIKYSKEWDPKAEPKAPCIEDVCKRERQPITH